MTASATVGHDGLRVEVVRHVAELAARRSAWDALAATAGSGEWFASAAWLLPWMASYGRDDMVRFCFVYRDAELVGVCPLLALDAESPGCAPSLGFPVNPQVRRIGALSTVPLDALLRAVLSTIPRERLGRCVMFRHLPTNGAFDTALTAAVDALGWKEHARPEPSSAIVQFGGGWDAYVSTRDRKLVRNVRSRRRKLDTDDRWRVRAIRDREQLATAWPAVLDIETRSWKHARGSSMLSEPEEAVFYRALADGAADAGRLQLHLLEHDGTPVAYAFSVITGGTSYLLKNSYDDAFKSSSPGMCLVWQVMEESAAAGCTTFDFLGDASDWKREFATAVPAYVTRTVFPPSSLHCQGCRFMEATLKPLGRRFGVKALLDTVRGDA